jgi:hypothetical protein
MATGVAEKHRADPDDVDVAVANLIDSDHDEPGTGRDTEASWWSMSGRQRRRWPRWRALADNHGVHPALAAQAAQTPMVKVQPRRMESMCMCTTEGLSAMALRRALGWARKYLG